MEKQERVRELIPLIGKIKDAKMRRGVVDVWVKAWEESAWVDIADCPGKATKKRKCNLIEHTNFVTASAMAMASVARDIWNIKVDSDLLLAAGILHDVDKVVSYAPEKGNTEKQTAIGESLVHGMYGAHLALNAGLPLSLAHLIATHSPQVIKPPSGVEGILVSYADFAAADLFRDENWVTHK